MNRREFVAGSLAFVGRCADQARHWPVRSADQDHLPVCGRRQRRHAVPASWRNIFLPLLDRNVIVENRTGGDGLIGIRSVKGAAPDGTTILVTTGPTMYLLPMVENQPSFDPAKDFVPVSQLARFEFVVVVSPSIGVTDFKQLVAWIKANPGEGQLWRAEQRHHSAFHRLAARKGAWPLHDARGRIAAPRRSSTISSAGTCRSPSRRCRTPSRSIAPAASGSSR